MITDDNNMIIMTYMHGLGNQMFQYALQRSLEKKGKIVKSNTMLYDKYFNMRKFELTSVFENIKLNPAPQLCNCIVYNENLIHSSIFIPDILDLNTSVPCILNGFFQTEKYFLDIREDLLQQFKFNITDKLLNEISNSIKNSKKPIVSIHVRRTDYLGSPMHNICTETYYKNAINEIYNRLNTKDIEFIVFSDDIEYCKTLFPDFTYIDKNQFEDYKDWYDMYLMSCCHHNIISNSSFAWWAAWLNQNQNKLVLAPNKWLNGLPTYDIWCEDWIKVNV